VTGERQHTHRHAHSAASLGGTAAGGDGPGEPSAALRRRVLWWALVANGVFMVVEIVGGFAFDSLALLADALHMGTDVAGLTIALVAQALILRPASARHTYGLQRAEVLGALVNGIILVAAAGWIFYEAIERLGQPASVDGAGVVVVATIGLAVNLGCAALLRRAQGRSLNLRGAYLHMVLDAAGSVAAIVAGLAVVIADADWVDPLMSMLVGVLVLWSTWGLLRDTVHVLLEGTPRGLDVGEVEQALVATPGVDAVHHLHVWDLASDTPALSAHVVLDGEPSLHDAQLRGEVMKAMLETRFGIGHATLELECHECLSPTDLSSAEHP
jgi:cobalt-zinc-cadmium efflux system protein